MSEDPAVYFIDPWCDPFPFLFLTSGLEQIPPRCFQKCRLFPPYLTCAVPFFSIGERSRRSLTSSLLLLTLEVYSIPPSSVEF